MCKLVHINSSDGVEVYLEIVERCEENIFVWPSSLVLSAYLVSISKLCKAHTFYEIGAGCGLPTLVAAKLGASKCYLTEKNHEVQFDILKTNVRRNGLDNICHIQATNWGESVSNAIKCDFIFNGSLSM